MNKRYWNSFPQDGNMEAGYYTDRPLNDYWIGVARDALERLTKKERTCLIKECLEEKE